MAKRHKVGNCSPPLHTRWRKGHSGNPKGRPRGSRNRASPWRASFDEIVKLMQADSTPAGVKLSACRIILTLAHGPVPGDAPIFPAMLTRLATLLRNNGNGR